MNQINGHILAIDHEGSIALLDVVLGDLRLSATILGEAQTLGLWKIEQPVQLQFNEMEVAIAKNLSGQISLRNRLPGTIMALEWGRILTRVSFQVLAAGTEMLFDAVITTRSARHLQLAVGDQIEGLVKSNEMHVLAASTEVGDMR
ncbi:MAG: TOBE domain-containing protein [Burkholderiales bacterium]|nr:TOBE domain-containing protein [Burkholderiales bacterium]